MPTLLSLTATARTKRTRHQIVINNDFRPLHTPQDVYVEDTFR